MARPKKLIPSYRHHKASGQAIVDIAGRVHYLGPHGTKASKLEYDRVIAEWLASGRSAPATDGLTIAQLLARYWTIVQAYYHQDGVPTGEQSAIRVALRFVRELYGPKPAVEFGPLALRAVQERMVEAGLARSTINQSVSRIKRMFRWASAEELVPVRCWTALSSVPGLRQGKTAAREAKVVLPIDDATLEATLPHMPEVVADMVQLQRFSGMRPAEVCMVRPQDIDRSGDIWIYRPESHKNTHRGHDRTVFLGPKSQDILLRYLARDPAMYCFRPCDSEVKRRAERSARRKTPMSCGNRAGKSLKQKPRRSAGDRYDTNSYGRAIHRACDKAFPHPTLAAKKILTEEDKAAFRAWQSEHRWSPNRLRHAAATEVRKRFRLEAAQIVLGHASADVSQIYAERDFAKGVEVARQIG